MKKGGGGEISKASTSVFPIWAKRWTLHISGPPPLVVEKDAKITNRNAKPGPGRPNEIRE